MRDNIGHLSSQPIGIGGDQLRLKLVDAGCLLRVGFRSSLPQDVIEKLIWNKVFVPAAVKKVSKKRYERAGGRERKSVGNWTPAAGRHGIPGHATLNVRWRRCCFPGRISARFCW